MRGFCSIHECPIQRGDAGRDLPDPGSGKRTNVASGVHNELHTRCQRRYARGTPVSKPAGRPGTPRNPTSAAERSCAPRLNTELRARDDAIARRPRGWCGSRGAGRIGQRSAPLLTQRTLSATLSPIPASSSVYSRQRVSARLSLPASTSKTSRSLATQQRSASSAPAPHPRHGWVKSEPKDRDQPAHRATARALRRNRPRPLPQPPPPPHNRRRSAVLWARPTRQPRAGPGPQLGPEHLPTLIDVDEAADR
jgi:hypothetical protein